MDSIRIPDGNTQMALDELDKQKHLLIKKIIGLFNDLPETYDLINESNCDNEIFLKKETHKYENGEKIKFPYRIYSSFSIINRKQNHISKYIIGHPIDLDTITQSENNTRFGLISLLVKMKTVNNYLFSKDVINQVLKLASDFEHIPTNVRVFRIKILHENDPIKILSEQSIYQFLRFLTEDALILYNCDQKCGVTCFLNNIDSTVFEYVMRTKNMFEKWGPMNFANFINKDYKGILLITNPYPTCIIDNNIFTPYGTPYCHLLCVEHKSIFRFNYYYAMILCNETNKLKLLEYSITTTNDILNIFISFYSRKTELRLFLDKILG
jgi:hypothetical protein